GANRFPGGDRGEHDVAIAEQVSAPPLSPGPRHHLCVQQMSAHGFEHAGKAARLPGEGVSGSRVATGVRPSARGADAQSAELIHESHESTQIRANLCYSWIVLEPICRWSRIDFCFGSHIRASMFPRCLARTTTPSSISRTPAAWTISRRWTT